MFMFILKKEFISHVENKIIYFLRDLRILLRIISTLNAKLSILWCFCVGGFSYFRNMFAKYLKKKSNIVLHKKYAQKYINYIASIYKIFDVVNNYIIHIFKLKLLYLMMYNIWLCKIKH